MGTGSTTQRPPEKNPVAPDVSNSSRSVRAIFLEELTQDEPILVLASSLAATCYGAGGLLSACFESYGAHVVLVPQTASTEDEATDRSMPMSSQGGAPLSDRVGPILSARLQTLRLLGCESPLQSISIIDARPYARTGIDTRALATILVDTLRKTGSHSIVVPQTDHCEPHDAMLLELARRLCSRDPHLRLWRCIIPSACAAQAQVGTPQPVGLRVLDVRQWQDAKRAAVQHGDRARCERTGIDAELASVPAERFWHDSTGSARRD